MRGVFLHVMGDFMGSVAAIASALVQKLAPTWKYKIYVDPTCSLIMVAILISAAIPLLRDALAVLIMKSSVERDTLKQLILKVDGVRAVHELHCWVFIPTKKIAHVHVVVGEEVLNKNRYCQV